MKFAHLLIVIVLFILIRAKLMKMNIIYIKLGINIDKVILDNLIYFNLERNIG